MHKPFLIASSKKISIRHKEQNKGKTSALFLVLLLVSVGVWHYFYAEPDSELPAASFELADQENPGSASRSVSAASDRRNERDGKASEDGVDLLPVSASTENTSTISTSNSDLADYKSPQHSQPQPKSQPLHPGSMPTVTPAVVSFMVTGLGLSASDTRLALTLPKLVTLGFVASADGLSAMMNRATRHGFDTMLNLPDHQGLDVQFNPHTVPAAKSSATVFLQDFASQLQELETRPMGIYLGKEQNIMSHATFAEIILPLVRDKRMALGYWLSQQPPTFAADHRENHRKKYRIIEFHHQLDESLEAGSIARGCDQLVRLSRATGRPAVGVIAGYPLSMRSLATWIRKNDLPPGVTIVRLRDIQSSNLPDKQRSLGNPAQDK